MVVGEITKLAVDPLPVPAVVPEDVYRIQENGPVPPETVEVMVADWPEFIVTETGWTVMVGWLLTIIETIAENEKLGVVSVSVAVSNTV